MSRNFSPTLLVALTAAGLLAGCGPKDSAKPADAPTATTAPPAASGGGFDADSLVGDDEPGPGRANQEPEPGLSLPPTGPERYIGVWAARPDLCATGGWRFRPDGLATAGETACAFSRVTERDGGFDVTGACTQDGAKRQSKLRLTFAEQAGAMTVEGAPLPSTRLVWCGPEVTD